MAETLAANDLVDSVRLSLVSGVGPLLRKALMERFGTAAAVLAVTFLLMDVFGFLVGATAIVAGFMALARADIKVMVGTAIAFPVALWLLFDKLLGFPLP
jgi:hypothetical protein